MDLEQRGDSWPTGTRGWTLKLSHRQVSRGSGAGAPGRHQWVRGAEGIPDDASVIRLVGAVLLEQHDDWAVSERRYLSEGSMALIDQPKEVSTTTNTRELPAA